MAPRFREFADEAAGILSGRHMEVDVADALELRADADQLSQMMLNLVANARAATTATGTVAIGAANDRERIF